jgi:hypothetical protein
VNASDASIESTVIRTTQPRADGTNGEGLYLGPACLETSSGVECDPETGSVVNVQRALIEQNHEMGVFVGGSELSMDASVIRATLARVAAPYIGRGLNVQSPCVSSMSGLQCSTEPSVATVRASLIENSLDAGVFVGGSELSLEASIVRATAAREPDGIFGDGVVVLRMFSDASASMSRVRIENSARAGLASFGADVVLDATHIACAPLALAGEPFQEQSYAFDDRGNNLCGCPSADVSCKVTSSGIAPPDPLEAQVGLP